MCIKNIIQYKAPRRRSCHSRPVSYKRTISTKSDRKLSVYMPWKSVGRTRGRVFFPLFFMPSEGEHKMRAGQNRDKFLLGGIQWVSSCLRFACYKCVLLLWKHTEIEIMVWGFLPVRPTFRSFRLPARLYLSSSFLSLPLSRPDAWYFLILHIAHIKYNIFIKQIDGWLFPPLSETLARQHFHIERESVAPESGPRRRLPPALFAADVSHTANSNTQLMLLYETNERTSERMNEKYKCRNI